VRKQGDRVALQRCGDVHCRDRSFGGQLRGFQDLSYLFLQAAYAHEMITKPLPSKNGAAAVVVVGNEAQEK